MKRNVQRRYPMIRIVYGTAAAAALAVLSGCGGGPFDIVPVSGKVTYKGGEPIPGKTVEVTFHPQVEKKGKEHPKPGHALLKEDGTFESVTTHKFGDGLIPGKHKVTVRALDENQNPIPGVIPDKYTDPTKTPLEIEVKGSGKLEPIEIEKP